ncbi:MAG: hypothetical protein J5944_13585, partial [Lentisphaeria bacterium]|nr:hypothetical protein [Lentisphaeria bacterium]
GLIFPEILSLSYQASPNGAKDYSQGIHPLVNEAKFCPSPNGAAESPGPQTREEIRLWEIISRFPRRDLLCQQSRLSSN